MTGQVSQSAPRKRSVVFDWRRSICDSTLPPTARHVALTMSIYMNESGGSAFPGGARLARETGLALRTVRVQLAILTDSGWLVVKFRGGSPVGGIRKATEYAAAIPLTGAGDAPVQEGNRCNSRHRPVHLTTLTGAGDAPQDVKKASVKASGKVSDVDSSLVEEFDAIWEHYPRKRDRAAAFRKYSALRKAGADAESLMTATRHFKESTASTEQKYIMHGSRFFGPDEPWREYLNPPQEQPVAMVDVDPAGVPRWD